MKHPGKKTTSGLAASGPGTECKGCLEYAGNFRLALIWARADIIQRFGLRLSIRLEKGTVLEQSFPTTLGRANQWSRKARAPVLLCPAFPAAMSSETFTPCGHATSQRWQPMQYSTQSVSLSTTSRRKRSMSGPNDFGPGYAGYALNTGQAALQSEHFTQLSSVRLSSGIMYSSLAGQHRCLVSGDDSNRIAVP